VEMLVLYGLEGGSNLLRAFPKSKQPRSLTRHNSLTLQPTNHVANSTLDDTVAHNWFTLHAQPSRPKHLSENCFPTTNICAQPIVPTRVGGYMRGCGCEYAV